MKTRRRTLMGLAVILAGFSLFACSGHKPVNPTGESVTITPKTLALYEGRTGFLQGRANVNIPEDGSIDWHSSDYSVALVSSGCCNGWLTQSASVRALKPGTARIIAYYITPDGAGHCDVTVLPVTAHRIDIVPDSLTLTVDSVRYISSLVYHSVGVSLYRTILDWDSADSTIASVSQLRGNTEGYGARNSSGKVLGRSRGRTYIVASIESASDSALVVVE